MLHFVCDWCSRVKEPEEAWIVGLAAEVVGVTAARREVTIQSAWDRGTAVHPLAVHFCSLECKDRYMARLFALPPPTEETVVEPLVTHEEVAVTRTVPITQTVATRAKRHKARGKKRAA
jgi:hypothetical protein